MNVKHNHKISLNLSIVVQYIRILSGVLLYTECRIVYSNVCIYSEIYEHIRAHIASYNHVGGNMTNSYPEVIVPRAM